MALRLEGLLRRSAAATPDARAAADCYGASVSYAELDRASDAIAIQLAGCGVAAGDRVGIAMPKSLASLAVVYGVMKAGAAYVPVDYTAPATRNAFIFSDCGARAIIASDDLADGLSAQFTHGGDWRASPLAGGFSGAVVLHAGAARNSGLLSASTDASALSYILYTSGSTGKPKGVMHSHQTALAFIDWCTSELHPQAADVFSSHAPFHFDLSILDLYVPAKHGAAVVLIDTTVGRQPQAIIEAIAREGITSWYSTPTILRMLMESETFKGANLATLRTMIFAGEVFPPKYLQKLVTLFPDTAHYNLYGPTETNVCTYYRAPEDFKASDGALPIGYLCSGDRGRVIDATGRDVERGGEGELIIAGGSVMLGYWNLPERNAEAFIQADGGPWYRTGDIVRQREDGAYIYLGRRDRMVKRRGYRVELGEIEAAINRHPSVVEAAVVAIADGADELSIKAYVAWAGEGAPSMIQMKKHCAQHVPLYMMPDAIVFLDTLPKTSTDKIDYQTLKGMA